MHQGVHLYPLGEEVVVAGVVGHQPGAEEVVEGQRVGEGVEQRREVGEELHLEGEGPSLGPQVWALERLMVVLAYFHQFQRQMVLWRVPGQLDTSHHLPRLESDTETFDKFFVKAISWPDKNHRDIESIWNLNYLHFCCMYM